MQLLAARPSGERADTREIEREVDAGRDAGFLEGDEDALPAAAPPPPRPPPTPTHVRDTLNAGGLDLAALLAAAIPSAATAPGEEASDAEDDTEVTAEQEDEEAEDVDDSATGTRATALAGIRDLLRMTLILTAPWPDEERSERKKLAAEPCRRWANSLRKHCNGATGHYYMHIAFAHIDEITEEHGHWQTGNDEVLEKVNRDMKRFRDMTWFGGDSSKTAKATKVKQTRYRLIRAARDGEEAEYEEYTVEVPRQDASWIACMEMQVAADLLAARRPHREEIAGLSKRQKAKRVRDASRDAVKAEGIASVIKVLELEGRAGE